MSHAVLESTASLLSSVVVERFGWLLVHSLWQFAVIALVALLLDRLLKRRTAVLRYATLLGGLMTMMASPVVTCMMMPDSLNAIDQSELSIVRTHQPATAELALDAAMTNGTLPAFTPPTADPNAEAPVAPADTASEPESLRRRLANAVAPWLGIIVGIWCCGVVLFSLRPVVSWINVHRLTTAGVSPVSMAVQHAFDRVQQRLKIVRRVQVLQSTVVNSPIVVGCFRSTILVPASFISGVPLSQLEAILAHELAHVQRYDYLVNLLQTLVETLFFYHPAVWWISHRIRDERENCCDDLVVTVLGNKVEYGRALLAVEEFRSNATSSLVLSANGGTLLARVQRLFPRPVQDHRSSAGLAALGILLAMITAAGVWTTVIAGADESSQIDTSKKNVAFGPEAVLKAMAPEIKLPDFLNVMAVGFSNDSQTLWSVSTKSDVRFRSWNVATQQKLHDVELDSDKHGNKFLMSELTLSPDLTRVAAIFERKVCLWDSTTGKFVQSLTVPPELKHDMLGGLSVSADLSRIACGLASGVGGIPSPDSHAVVWDVVSGDVVKTVEHTGALQTRSTALSADGRWLATGGQQAGLWIWEVATGRLVHSIANSNPELQHPNPEVTFPGTDQILSLSFSPDGKLLAMADMLTVKIFDTESGELLHTMNRPFRYGRSGLVFSPDGQLLARIATDKTVPIWSIESGELVAVLPTEAHGGSFSPDGQWFAACFTDGAEGIGLWRLRQVANANPKPNPQDEQARLPWRARGRVADADGKPLEGVTIRAATGVGTLRGSSTGLTDADGRYDFRFGPGVPIGPNKNGTTSPQSQFALISAVLDGHFEQNLSRDGNGIASLEPVAADALKDWGVEPEQVCLPDKPREVNFVMLPAAKVSGTLVGDDDKPLKDYSVSLTAEKLPPGHSVLAQVYTDENGRFEITEIPTTIFFQIAVRKPHAELRPPWDDSWASGPLMFLDPGENDLATRVETDSVKVNPLTVKSLRLKIVDDGVHDREAVRRAATQNVFGVSERIKLTDATIDLFEFTIALSNYPVVKTDASLVP